MKQIFLFFINALIVSVTFFACNKDKNTMPEKKVLLTKIVSQGSLPYTLEYTYDDAGRTVEYSQTYTDEPESNTKATVERNAKGQIVKLMYTINYRDVEYEYDGQGRVVKSKEIPGSSGYYYVNTYEYFADRFENIEYLYNQLDGSNETNGKTVCYYTADKKNIAMRKVYYGSTQLYEYSYTYATGKKAIPELDKLFTPFVSENLVATETMKDFNRGTTRTITRTYTYNGDGYPITSQAGNSVSTTVINTSFEYTTR